MRQNILLATFCFLLCAFIVRAQTPPNAFNYSAVARNASGQPIATATIGIQISILKGSTTGPVQYSENHAVNTDAFGLFNLVIGGGAVQSGSMGSINWGNDVYYLKVGMDASGGTNFLTMGTTQLLSVPYSMHAKTAENGIDRISGDTLYLTNGQSFVSSASGGGIGNLVLPTVSTSVSDVGANGFTLIGNVSNLTGNTICSRGILLDTFPNLYINSGCYGSNPPTGNGSFGYFTDTISHFHSHSIFPNKTYFARAWVVNENGIIIYGNTISFTTMNVGQTGQAGGIVYYDKGKYTDGWRYLEVAPIDQSTGIQWGCSGTLINIIINNPNLPSGIDLTNGIVAGCNDTNFAAKLCSNLTLGGKSDWFLPTYVDLLLINRILNLSNEYWTCEEFTNLFANTVVNGTQSADIKSNQHFVRAVRAY